MSRRGQAVQASTAPRAAAGDRAFLGASALLFGVTSAAAVLWCGSMAGGMPMPGGWTMSMAWMRMPGQSWPGAAAAFLAMWLLMMVAMMLPSSVAMLSRYRRSLGAAGQGRLGAPTAIAGAGYFLAWAACGAVAYPLGAAVAAAEMEWPALARSVPLASGAILVAAGCLQMSRWKARQLACCRQDPGAGLPPAGAGGAFRHGLRLGGQCILCCSALTAVLLVAGVMDLAAMAVVAAAITAERLAPRPELVARVTGAAVVAAGAVGMALALAAA